MCARVYLCGSVHACVWEHACMCVGACVHVWVHACLCVWVRACICVSVRACICVWMHACMHVCGCVNACATGCPPDFHDKIQGHFKDTSRTKLENSRTYMNAMSHECYLLNQTCFKRNSRTNYNLM